ncbi:hypothetical protein M5C96_18945 [Acidovorax sp. GBBC 1281]|uniref:hypothetical protein n=1 Tax=Acidovorax sp. GBBC 1281 TaxID=2940492 RepID=UPI00234AE4F7|nr:hypothetical protein [Acidovorax sp. GBBC 1281]WCM96489.1 hypothetical protein M5C96_18945 [Acidovorax sp. GBBC 1281]
MGFLKRSFLQCAAKQTALCRTLFRIEANAVFQALHDGLTYLGYERMDNSRIANKHRPSVNLASSNWEPKDAKKSIGSGSSNSQQSDLTLGGLPGFVAQIAMLMPVD